MLRLWNTENSPACKGNSGIQFAHVKFQMPLMYPGDDVKEEIGTVSLDREEVLEASKHSGP